MTITIPHNGKLYRVYLHVSGAALVESWVAETGNATMYRRGHWRTVRNDAVRQTVTALARKETT